MSYKTIEQVIIAVLSCFTITALTLRHHKLGCVVGLFGQPLWLRAMFVSEQYGMLLVSCWFTITYAIGIYKHWKEKW